MKYWIITIFTVLAMAAGGFAAEPRTKKKPAAAKVEPLTYANVVSFFKAAHFRPTEVQKRCTIFFEGEWKNTNVYAYCVIMVENSDEDVQVTFYLTDAHEMNWLTEFLDAPFFAGDETQRLYDIMNSGREVRGDKIGRFRVDFHRLEPRHAQIIVFSFTPLRQS
jgi:hypothetical protein